MTDTTAPEKPAASPAADSASPRRRTTPKQALVRVRQRLETLKKHEAVLAEKAREHDQAILAKQGRMIYLVAVEEMHQGERDLQVGEVLKKLPEGKRAPVEAWLASLAK